MIDYLIAAHFLHKRTDEIAAVKVLAALDTLVEVFGSRLEHLHQLFLAPSRLQQLIAFREHRVVQMLRTEQRVEALNVFGHVEVLETHLR